MMSLSSICQFPFSPTRLPPFLLVFFPFRLSPFLLQFFIVSYSQAVCLYISCFLLSINGPQNTPKNPVLAISTFTSSLVPSCSREIPIGDSKNLHQNFRRFFGSPTGTSLERLSTRLEFFGIYVRIT